MVVDPALYKFTHSGKHQFRALFRKNASLQKRQVKANVCQILTPLFMLGLVLAFQELINWAMPAPDKGGELVDLTQMSVFYAPNASAVANSWDHYMLIDAPDNSLGTLNKDGTKSGLLGYMMQHPYFYPGQNVSSSDFVPYFTKMANTEAMGEKLYDLIYAAQQEPPFMFMKLANPLTGKCPRGETFCLEYGGKEMQMLKPVRYSLPSAAVTVESRTASGLRLTVACPDISYDDPFERQQFDEVGDYYPDTKMGDLDMTRAFVILNEIISSWLFSTVSQVRTVFSMVSLPFVTEPEKNMDIGTMTATFLYPFAISFALPLYVYQIVLEKQSKLKLLLKCSGVNMLKYWSASFAYDFILWMAIATMFSVGGIILDQNFFMLTDPSIWITLFILWGLCQISFAFFLSTLFTKTKSANIATYSVVIAGVSFSMLINAWFYFKDPLPVTFYIFPGFACYRAIWLICGSIIDVLKKPMELSDLTPGEELFQLYVGMLVVSIMYLILTWYMEEVFPGEFGVAKHPLFFLGYKKSNKKEKSGKIVSLSNEAEFTDIDVAEQQTKIDNGVDGMIVLNKLNKVYEAKVPTVAIRSLSFYVKKGEFFGFIGPNGAGKSTLISILSGMIPYSEGDVIVNGKDLTDNLSEIQQHIGVCPQFECVWSELTVREHLLFFARIRGVTPDMENAVVVNMTADMGLSDAIDRRSNQLSGGMRRRLAVAMALVGGPDVILLDEPSTGLDPVSRKQLWDVLKRISRITGATFILTTHSMEEAEFLSERVSILASGKMKAIGTSLHLKHRFGDGYRLTIITDKERVGMAKDLVANNWPKASLTTEFNGMVVYKIPLDACVLSKLVLIMEDNKKLFDDWGITQSSLNEVWSAVLSDATSS